MSISKENMLNNWTMDEYIEPALPITTSTDGKPTGQDGPSAAYYEAGGETVLVSIVSKWTHPEHPSNAKDICDQVAKAICDEDEPVPESAIDEGEKLSKRMREHGDPYVRVDLNLITGYARLSRFPEAFQRAKQLATEEPQLKIFLHERIAIYQQLGISAFRLYQQQNNQDPNLLTIASESYARANSLSNFTNLDTLCWGARVELELENHSKAETLWNQVRKIVADAPEQGSTVRSILNKDACLREFDRQFK